MQSWDAAIVGRFAVNSSRVCCFDNERTQANYDLVQSLECEARAQQLI